jgi:two-component system CheB/CheR fusion protein
LGTTKEELQSANEELITVNEELQNRNHELGILNDDLNNLLAAVNTPILVVDRGLQLRRISPAAEEPLGLSSADLGRPIADLAKRTKMPKIDHLVHDVIDSLAIVNQELQDQEGCWWSLGVRPYRTSDHRIEGTVVTFSNIDSLKRSLQTAEESRDYAEGIVDTVREPLVVLSPELRVERANAAFYRTFQIAKEAAEGRNIYQLDGGDWDIPQLQHALEEVFPRKSFFEAFVVEHDFPRIGMRSMSLNARRILQRGSMAHRILLAIEDVTD